MNNNGQGKKSTKGKAGNKSSSQQPRKARTQNKSSNGNKKQSNGQQNQKFAASAYATATIGKAPIIKQTNQNCRVKHRELLMSVTGSVLFDVVATFALNPGLAASFPWLSGIAANWEQYRFISLRYCYLTRTGTNVPGSVMMVPDYDAADTEPLTEQIASSFEDVVEDAPWKDITCILPSRRLNSTMPYKTVRTGALANNLDVKTYDSGNMFICAVDGTAVNWGKVWVEYEVEFIIPQLPPQGGNFFAGGRITGGGSFSAAVPMGSVPVPDDSVENVSVGATSIVTFNFPGLYIMNHRCTGTTVTDLTATAIAGCTVGTAYAVLINSAATIAIFESFINVTSAGATVQLTATAAAVSAGLLYIGKGPLDSYS